MRVEPAPATGQVRQNPKGGQMDHASDTRAAALLHHRAQNLSPSDPIALPLTSSATFYTPDLANLTHVYGRSGMPTWEAVEAQLALLEEAETVAFGPGLNELFVKHFI